MITMNSQSELDRYSITPSYEINFEIRRWVRGMITEAELDFAIANAVRVGDLHPNTDIKLIKTVALRDADTLPAWLDESLAKNNLSTLARVFRFKIHQA